MSTLKRPTPKRFEAQFREHIRVGFTWDRFFAESWPIEILTLNSFTSLKRCFMPWYIGKSGEEVAYYHAEAAPLNLLDVSKACSIFMVSVKPTSKPM